MRYILAAAFALQITFGNVCMAQMMHTQEVSTHHQIAEDTSHCAEHDAPIAPNFDCMNHCLTQATENATGSAAPNTLLLTSAMFPTPPCDTVFASAEGATRPLPTHHALAPPHIQTVVLRQ
jgi:hypothetical protein